MSDGQLKLSNPVGKNFKGAYPDKLDISLQGRNNADSGNINIIRVIIFTFCLFSC